MLGVLADDAPGGVGVEASGPAALPVTLIKGRSLRVLVVGAGAQELSRVGDVYAIATDVVEAAHRSATHAIQAVVSSARSLEERESSLVGVAHTPPSSSSMQVQARPDSSRTTVPTGRTWRS